MDNRVTFNYTFVENKFHLLNLKPVMIWPIYKDVGGTSKKKDIGEEHRYV